MSLRLVGCVLLCFGLLVSNNVCHSLSSVSAHAIQEPAKQDQSKSEKDQKPESAPKEATPDVAAKPESGPEKSSDKDQSDKPAAAAEVKPAVAKQEATAVKKSELKSTELLPPSTRAWISIPDMDRLESQFEKTQLGQLAADESFKPFFEAAKTQLQDYLDEKNLKVGLKIDDILGIRAGEVCIAGVLQDLEGGQPARGSHGLVLLVDVTGNEVKTNELLVKVNAELQKKNGGSLETIEINSVKVTKLSSQNPKRIRLTQQVFQATHNGWLLVADNEEIFRDILRRLDAPKKIDKAITLNSYAPYAKVMKETELFGVEAELSWFVDPFGYIQLARKLYEEEQEIREHHKDWASVLQDVGFDAVKGMGGNLAISVRAKEQDVETISRVFVYAPRENVGEKQQRFFDLVDFASRKSGATDPPAMIAEDSSAFLGGSWDFTKLLWSFGHVWDSIQEEGDFKRMLNDFKNEPQFQVDVPKLIGLLDNQLFVFSTTAKPISSESERAAIGIPLSAGADHAYVFESLRKMAKGSVVIDLAGKKVIEVDTTKVDEELDKEFEGLGKGFEDEEFEDLQEEEEEPKRFSLFEKRYMLVQNGVLIVANDKQYMRQLIGRLPSQKLVEAKDYVRVKEVLGKMTDESKISFRRFVRLDRIFEVNYEILRKGEMASSPTMMGRILNQAYKSDTKNAGQERKQRLDGSKLPEDYQAKVAPYLGPTGWVTEVEADGWRITGCLLKK